MTAINNALSNLKTDTTIQDEKDVLGSGGPLDSDLYKGKIELAYLEQSSGGALALNLRLKTDTGRELRQQLWMTSGSAKGGKNYYERNGEKHYLPGFLLANSLSLLTVGKEIDVVAATAESKVVKLYSAEVKKEVPTQVPVLTELLGQEIYAGVIKQKVDKNAKGDDGQYHATGEVREENEIDKFFRAKDRMTTAEIRAGATEPTFFESWKQKWAGQVRDRSTGAASGSGKVGVSPGAAKNSKPTQSLFA
jgi:hypothetical protein